MVRAQENKKIKRATSKRLRIFSTELNVPVTDQSVSEPTHIQTQFGYTRISINQRSTGETNYKQRERERESATLYDFDLIHFFCSFGQAFVCAESASTHKKWSDFLKKKLELK